jgi:hypothetical protein
MQLLDGSSSTAAVLVGDQTAALQAAAAAHANTQVSTVI